MMRSKYLALPLLAALAAPVVANADGLLRRNNCNSGCNTGGAGGGLFGGHKGWGGGHNIGNAPAQYSTKNGLGLFQPPFQASPWYLYWPYDQHFQLPAPIGAPFVPPQHLHSPWNPYFAHPGFGPGAAPHYFQGMPGHPHGHPHPHAHGGADVPAVPPPAAPK